MGFLSKLKSFFTGKKKTDEKKSEGIGSKINKFFSGIFKKKKTRKQQIKDVSGQPTRYSIAVYKKKYLRTARAEIILNKNPEDQKVFDRLKDYLESYLENRKGLNKMDFPVDKLSIYSMEKEKLGDNEFKPFQLNKVFVSVDKD